MKLIEEKGGAKREPSEGSWNPELSRLDWRNGKTNAHLRFSEKHIYCTCILMVCYISPFAVKKHHFITYV